MSRISRAPARFHAREPLATAADWNFKMPLLPCFSSSRYALNDVDRIYRYVFIRVLRIMIYNVNFCRMSRDEIFMDGLDDGLGERFNARNNLKCLLGIFPPRGKVLGKSID